MNAISLAFSLIRVPRLFISLLLWPLIVGLSIAILQAVSSSVYFGVVNETSEQAAERLDSENPGDKWLRLQLYDTQKTLDDLKVCVWKDNHRCKIEPHDVVIRTTEPQKFDAADYVKLFQGSTRTLHICKDCSSEVVITIKPGDNRSDIHSLPGLGILMLTDSSSSTKAGKHFVEARRTWEHLKDISGTVYLHPDGLEDPINMTQATKIMLLIMNTALITVIALWLSLKGHRKVLDYFSSNGALLPLVAATGKNTFYTALWIITILRVSLFLVASLPATIFVYAQAVPEDTLKVFIRNGPDFILWLAALISSLCCLALVASIAELKQRHSIVSLLYRYIPLALCLTGSIIWFYAIFTNFPYTKTLQVIISCIPIIGISPVLTSPIFNLNSTVVAAHSLLATCLVIVLLRINSRWFAAHLEEI